MEFLLYIFSGALSYETMNLQRERVHDIYTCKVHAVHMSQNPVVVNHKGMHSEVHKARSSNKISALCIFQ